MSEAQKLRRALEAEQRKPMPDDEVLYAIKLRMPYANTVDTEKFKRGDNKLGKLLKAIA